MVKDLVITEDCPICNRTNVVSIDNDLIHKIGFQDICKRNGLEYNVKTTRELMIHFRDHRTSPSQALARSMIHKEAVELKNLAVETNLAMDQIDSLKANVFLKTTDDQDMSVKDYTLLVRAYTDLLKQGEKYMQLHRKVSGKDAADDIQKAALTSIVAKISDELGEEKIKSIRSGRRSRKKPMEYLMRDPHLAAVLAELEGEIDDAAI